MTAANPKEPFVFSSPEGKQLVNGILKNSLPYAPHDDQVSGICKTLDGTDVLIVSATGTGKTGFFYMVIFVILAINKDPTLCPSAKFKKDPAMVVLCPTNALEVDMRDKMLKLGLNAVALNRDTIEEARRDRGEDLWVTVRKNVSMILTNSDQLKSKNFADLAAHKGFSERLCALGVDEIHLLSTWGLSLRPSLRQIGHVRARLPAVPLIALTGTLRPGTPTTSVCSFLGLRTGQFFFLRRSNIRHDVQLIFRPMTSSVNGFKFPELDWVLREDGKVLIFTRTINLGFRVALYLWYLIEPAKREKRLRMYNALNWSEYNDATRLLLHTTADSEIIIATATLSVGVDIPNFTTVIMFGDLPADSDEFVQKLGRVGRIRVAGVQPRAILYYPSMSLAVAEKVVEAGEVKKGGKGKDVPAMEVSIARLLLAKCIPEEQDRLYDNPGLVHCLCGGCELNPPLSRPNPCICSRCLPEELCPAVVPVAKPAIINPIPAKHRLTKALRLHGTTRLTEFRFHILFGDAEEKSSGCIPPRVYLPDGTIRRLLDHFALLRTIEDIEGIVQPNVFFPDVHYQSLLTVINELRTEFGEMRLQAKEAATHKRLLERESTKHISGTPTTNALDSDDGGFDSEESDSDCGIDNSEPALLELSGSQLPKLRINFL